MKDLTLKQSLKLVNDIANQSLTNYNTKHPEKKVDLKFEDSYRLGVLQIALASLLAKHESIDDFINNYKNLLPME